jgi:hypothetical protein
MECWVLAVLGLSSNGQKSTASPTGEPWPSLPRIGGDASWCLLLPQALCMGMGDIDRQGRANSLAMCSVRRPLAHTQANREGTSHLVAPSAQTGHCDVCQVNNAVTPVEGNHYGTQRFKKIWVRNHPPTATPSCPPLPLDSSTPSPPSTRGFLRHPYWLKLLQDHNLITRVSR